MELLHSLPSMSRNYGQGTYLESGLLDGTKSMRKLLSGS